MSIFCLVVFAVVGLFRAWWTNSQQRAVPQSKTFDSASDRLPAFGETFPWQEDLVAAIAFLTEVSLLWLGAKELIYQVIQITGSILQRMPPPEVQDLLIQQGAWVCALAYGFLQIKKGDDANQLADSMGIFSLGGERTKMCCFVLGVVIFFEWQAILSFASTLQRMGRNPNTAHYFWRYLLSSSLLTPIAEETFSMGMFYHVLRKGLLNTFPDSQRIKRGAGALAVTVATLLFIIAHFQNPFFRGANILLLVAMSVIYATAYLRSRTLILPVLLHAAHNGAWAVWMFYYEQVAQ